MKKKAGTLSPVNTSVVDGCCPEAITVEIRRVEAAEVDERWSFVQSNAHPRWLWHAIDHLTGVVLAYATTIHKSQGSEYPAVVMPLSTQHFTLLERNLLYTGVTRGKRLVVVIAQPKALALAVRTVRAHQRLTNLAQRLRLPTASGARE